MKRNAKFTILVLSALAMGVVNAKADPVTIQSPVGTFTFGTTTPWTTYTYTNPQLSVYAGVQFGANQHTTVVQGSALNVSSLAQVGNNLSTAVAQVGNRNFSAIAQNGHLTSALVYQFGR
jgi:hypothetical protein